MRASDQIGDLAKALATVQGILRPLSKNREVSVKMKSGGTYKFSYTTFDAIIDAVREPLAENGLAFAQGVGYDGVGSVLTTRLMHTSGQWIESDTPIQVTDNGAQAFGSGITYAKRYALSSMLGIATDFDDDGNGSEGNDAETRDRHQRQPQRPTTPPAQPRNGLAEGAAEAWKDWALGDQTRAWFRDAKQDLGRMQTAEEVGLWQKKNRKEIDALYEYAIDRHASVMDLINERLNAVRAKAPTNLRAAG